MDKIIKFPSRQPTLDNYDKSAFIIDLTEPHSSEVKLRVYKGNGGEVVIPHGVTKIGNDAFGHCDTLVSVTIPNSVEVIERNAFGFCAGLKSVTLGNRVYFIGQQAFAGCAFESIVIPESVMSMDRYVFDNCKNLKKIYCEADGKTDFWERCWKGCNAKVIWGYKR